MIFLETGFTIWWIRVRDDTGDGLESMSSRTEEERRLETGGEASSVVLRALSCGATYSVRAVAHSRAGPSPPSVPLLVKTKPPGKIINIVIHIFLDFKNNF